MKFADVPKFGIVIGIHSHQASYYFEDVGRLTEERLHHHLDLLLENIHGERKLLRVPVGQDVADFFHLGGRPLPIRFRDAPKNPVDIGELEAARMGRERALSYWEGINPKETVPIGTASVPKLTGTSCPECGELQYETPSGTTCINGHGGA